MSAPRVLVVKDSDASQHDALLAAALSMSDTVEVLEPPANALDAAQLAAAITAWWNEHHCQSNTLVLLAASAAGVEMAARLAAGLGGTSMGACTQLQLQGPLLTAHKPVCGGRAMATLTMDHWPCFVALRPVRATPTGTAVRTHPLRVHAEPAFPTQELPATDTQRVLAGARLVVSGGRGMGGPQGFELLSKLAEHLDAALGGSLPTVDAGWVPVARQVGQSGKFVAPRAYVAVGISGTPQHMAGVSQETRIIAINKDADAPIFQLAEVGVVGEWQEILPLVLERLDARAAGENL